MIAEAEAENLSSEEAKAKTHNTDPRIVCDIPLINQIPALMAPLSPAQRDRPWSMDELASRLRGRFSLRAHPMNISTKFQQLGWKRRRLYGKDFG